MLWKIAGIIFLAILIAIIEVPGLLKKKLKKELWVFLFLLSIGFGLGLARSMNIEIPSPLNAIIFIYKPISDWIFQLLK